MLVSSTVLVGDLLAGGGIEIAQEQVNGGKAANAVAVFDFSNLLVEFGRIPVQNGLYQLVIGLLQGRAARLVHNVIVVEGGANMGQVYGGDGEDVFACGFAL